MKRKRLKPGVRILPLAETFDRLDLLRSLAVGHRLRLFVIVSAHCCSEGDLDEMALAGEALTMEVDREKGEALIRMVVKEGTLAPLEPGS